MIVSSQLAVKTIQMLDVPQPRNMRQTIVYFFLVGGCARHLQNPATKCDLPIC
jgi:hypothetical protein